MNSLSITDLSINEELDAQAMAAVRGGIDDQAIGVSQGNGQVMGAAANIGNASLFAGGPATIQSDNAFTQNAANYNTAANVDALLVLGRLGGMVRPF
jgi:hypothetical protein